MKENLTLLHVKNKDADHPGHLLSLISIFVFHSLQRVILKPVLYKITLFQLVFVAEKTGLSMTL